MKIYEREYFLRKILECSEEELQTAKVQKDMRCSVTRIPKKGGVRTIVSISSGSVLERLQKNLQKNFFSKISVSPAAKGFIRGSSYVDFLEEHIGHEYFLRLDIRNFFDSISEEILKENLAPFVAENNAEKTMIDDITEICTWEGRVPQGFVTSPAVSNLIFRRIDQRIRKYTRTYYKEMKREIFYTRYADDMLFSAVGFDFKHNKNFKRMIAHILEENGFSCNERKTIFQRGEISLSGYVVKEDVHLSRKKLHNINEVIHQFDSRGAYTQTQFKIEETRIDIRQILKNLNAKKMKKSDGSEIQFANIRSLVHYVAGYRSFLIQIARVEHGDTGYDRQISAKIKKLEIILDYLSRLLEEA